MEEVIVVHACIFIASDSEPYSFFAWVSWFSVILDFFKALELSFTLMGLFFHELVVLHRTPTMFGEVLVDVQRYWRGFVEKYFI